MHCEEEVDVFANTIASIASINMDALTAMVGA